MSAIQEIKKYGPTLKATDEGSFLTLADKMWKRSYLHFKVPEGV